MTTEKISLDNAYHLNCIINRLSDKSKKTEFEMAIWSLKRSQFCEEREDIRQILTEMLWPAQFACKKIVKTEAIAAVRAYIAGITK